MACYLLLSFTSSFVVERRERREREEGEEGEEGEEREERERGEERRGEERRGEEKWRRTLTLGWRKAHGMWYVPTHRATPDKVKKNRLSPVS